MKDYDLEEAARTFRDDFLEKNDNDVSKYDIEDIFIAGAEWKKEQFEKIENYQEEGWNSNSRDEEYIYGISFEEPIKLPVEFYVKKK